MGNWTPIVGIDIKNKALKAIELRKQGVSVQAIAKKLGLSPSRIYEYLRGQKKKQNWNSKKG